MTLRERFEKKFQRGSDSECWLWTAAKNNKGYGMFGVGYKVRCAPRVAYELYVGEIPDGKEILHSCDNPLCVNPNHLTPGTHAENQADMKSRGRSRAPRGAENHLTKLTADQVLAIRADTRFQRVIAKDFGVSKGAISAIKTRFSWAYL